MIFKDNGKVKDNPMVYNAVSRDDAAVRGLWRGPKHPLESLPSLQFSEQATVLSKLNPDPNENDPVKMDSAGHVGNPDS